MLITCCIHPMADLVLSALQQRYVAASYVLLPSSCGLALHLPSFTQHPSFRARYSHRTCSMVDCGFFNELTIMAAVHGPL